MTHRRAVSRWMCLVPAAIMGALIAACAPAAPPPTATTAPKPTAAPAAPTTQAAAKPTAPATAPAAKPTAAPTEAPKPVTPIAAKVIWTAVTGAQSGLFIAQEAGYFKEEGLTTEMIHIPSSSRAISALLANEAQFSSADAGNVVQGVLQGADVRIFLAATNRMVFSVMASPSIQSPQDLKGKKMGITRVGSSTHTAALQALNIWGLKPDKDVALIALTEVPNILVALQAGQIDAGVVSPPTNTRARNAGFKELINLATDGPDYPSVTIAATRSYLSSNPEAARRFTRAYSRALHTFRTDKETSLKAINKYLQLDDPSVLEDTWQQFSRYLPTIPYVPVAGMERIIADIAAENPSAAGAKPDQFLDSRFVKELEDAGFYKKLYGN